MANHHEKHVKTSINIIPKILLTIIYNKRNNHCICFVQTINVNLLKILFVENTMNLHRKVDPCTWSSLPSLCKRKFVREIAFRPSARENLLRKQLSDPPQAKTCYRKSFRRLRKEVIVQKVTFRGSARNKHRFSSSTYMIKQSINQ